MTLKYKETINSHNIINKFKIIRLNEVRKINTYYMTPITRTFYKLKAKQNKTNKQKKMIKGCLG